MSSTGLSGRSQRGLYVWLWLSTSLVQRAGHVNRLLDRFVDGWPGHVVGYDGKHIDTRWQETVHSTRYRAPLYGAVVTMSILLTADVCIQSATFLSKASGPQGSEHALSSLIRASTTLSSGDVWFAGQPLMVFLVTWRYVSTQVVSASRRRHWDAATPEYRILCCLGTSCADPITNACADSKDLSLTGSDSQDEDTYAGCDGVTACCRRARPSPMSFWELDEFSVLADYLVDFPVHAMPADVQL